MAAAVSIPSPLAAAPTPRFTRFSVEQGLSQSTVQAILQDHLGFLWFGTEEGLNRFDGYSFVVFKHDPKDPTTLADNLASALYEDRERRLWVGTRAGLSLYDRRTETFSSAASLPGGVAVILEDAEGTLWVGTGYGLFARDPATGVFRQHLPDRKDPAGSAGSFISALARDREGGLWVGSRGGGVSQLARGAKRFVHHRHDPRNPGSSLAHDEVWGLAVDAAGHVWVATFGGGLSVLDPRTRAFRHYRHRPGDPGSLGTDLASCLLADRSGAVWIGTDGAGVQRYEAKSDRFVRILHDPADPHSLSRNVVRSMHEDARGQIWVGTFMGGVNLLKSPRAFEFFLPNAADAASLSDAEVKSFLEDAKGRIWVGMRRGWIDRYDRQASSFTHYRFPSDLPGGSALLSLHQDRRGRIWAGSYRGGLGRFDPERGTFVIHKHRPGDPGSLGNDEVWAIEEDREGALWLATNDGLDRFDPERGTVTAHVERLGTATVGGARALVHDRDGNLWVGTFGGLHRLPPGRGEPVHYQHDRRDPSSLSHDVVVALHEDRQGRLWVGTYGGGLNRLDPATGRFTAYQGFPSNVVLGIEEEPSGRLWLSTNHGLTRFDPATERAEHFDLSNGLQSLQFQPGASLKTRDGRLLFGSVDGFYDFDPQAIRPDTHAPPVVLTSLRVFNEPAALPAAIPTLEEVTLSHRDQVFSLEFAALDYTFPRRNRYVYTMEGFSDRWIDLGPKRDVTFTNLDPGTYVFRVKASNGDGLWSDSSRAALKIVIRPPFWETWWFRGLALALVAAALVALDRVRIRRLAEHERELQALVDARTRDLRDTIQLKDEVVSIVAHDFRSPLTLILGYCERLQARAADADTRHALEIIGDRARHLAALAADTLTMSRIETGNLPLDPRPVPLVGLVRQTVDGRSSDGGGGLSVEAPEEGLVVRADPERLQEVVENLVGNAVKYSPKGSRVEVTIQREGPAARVSVTDQGPGIAPEDVPRLFQKFSRLEDARRNRIAGTGLGLYICRSIVEAHGGRIWVESVPGRGATFHFTIPLLDETAARTGDGTATPVASSRPSPG